MDLSTRYMGLELKHPIVASAGPLSNSLDGIKRLEDGGAAAIVMFSLFEEQIRRENEAFDFLTQAGTESFAESLSYFPEVEDYHIGPDQYLNLIRGAKESCNLPIIGSLNGVTDSGWIDYAKEIQLAGADALELNIFYIPADIALSGRAIEEQYVEIVRHVKSAVSIPVAVKMVPFFSSIGEVAKRLEDAGADGLVLFNRFYQPDYDLDELEVTPSLELSTANEIRLPLMWIDLAATGTGEIAAKQRFEHENQRITLFSAKAFGDDIGADPHFLNERNAQGFTTSSWCCRRVRVHAAI